MNIQEYISSGIVESYVLGLAEKEERAQFEKMCATHREVRAAREAFEVLLEKQALTNAIEPPADIKARILSEIGNERRSFAPVIPLNDGNRLHKKAAESGRWRFLTAAAIILLLGSTALNFYFFSQYKQYSARYDNLLAEQQQLAANNNSMQAKLQSYESAIAMIKDPNMAVVKMPGTNVPTSPDPASLATVYWDTRTKNVYLLVNRLPEPVAGKQYQLWAIVDGKPVDAGVIDTRTPSVLLPMKNIPKAEAFAITLEKSGGNSTPTMDQMYVMSKV